MPISEDEFDPRQGQEAQSTMSKAELRKTHKPIMEKRRRARINHCLNEIKTLILEAMKKDPARHSKLEKADILEMAVKHLQNVQRQQLAMAIATDPSVLRKFKSGFNECTDEINKYVNQVEGVDQSLKDRINSHLTKCMSGIEQVVQFTMPGFSGIPFLNSGLFAAPKSPGDQNNNPRLQIPQGLQLIPSRLPTGEFALLLPNSGSLPFLSSVPSQPSPSPRQSTTTTTQQRPSAFVTVVPSTITSNSLKSPSPPVSPNMSSANDDVILVSHTSSPQGFRPVQPHHKSAFTLTKHDLLHQVPQVTSTSLDKGPSTSHQPQQELKSIRYPIHNYHEKDKKQQHFSPKKVAEPLCIITNQSERYKQAQTIEDTVNYPENIAYGVKRKHSDQGLLTVATAEFLQPSQKRFKPQEYEWVPRRLETVEVPHEQQRREEQKAGCSSFGEQKNVEGSDMWRPW